MAAGKHLREWRRKLRQPLNIYKDYCYWKSFNGASPIRMYNFWKDEPLERMWLYRFVRHRDLLPADKTLSFISTLGPRILHRWDNSDYKVFYTGENVHNGHHLPYSDNMLTEKNICLSLGFDYLQHDRYLRLPLWVLYNFPPESDCVDITNIISGICNAPPMEDKDRFCALLARGDGNGIRTTIKEAVDKIDKVSCGGLFMHNDDTLLTEFHDSKSAWLKRFRFNICPENSDAAGYVTEKLFQAIVAGCVPVYWGSGNQPEPEVVNPDAVIFYTPQNDAWLRQIEDLESSPARWREFASQPRLKPTAADAVCEMFTQLESRLREVLQ